MKFLKSLKSNQLAVFFVQTVLLQLWGFASLHKILGGYPEWFTKTFATTVFNMFPGLTVSYWLITAAELLAFALTVVSFFRLEFTKRNVPFLRASLVVSLANFSILLFGMNIAGNGDAQNNLFTYFVLCLVMYIFVDRKEVDDAVPL